MQLNCELNLPVTGMLYIIWQEIMKEGMIGCSTQWNFMSRVIYK